MKKLLLSVAMSAIMAVGYSADVQRNMGVDIDGYMSSVIKRANQTDRHWRKSGLESITSQQKRVVTKIEDQLGPSSSWGSLYTPDGVEWMYTADYKYATTSASLRTIESAEFTIYNENYEVYKTFTANFELQPGDATVNLVQLSPVLTKKFFDINDSYEVMVYVHAATEDYNGNYYTQVYSLSNGKLINTIPGNQIGAVNTATDAWSERYTMVFMREEVEESTESFDYYLYFDVYSRAGWGSGCTLEKTFKINYANIAGAGNNALPILINKNGNDVVYALPYYEKPYFVSDWSDDITPDNHFIIDLYDSSFNLIKTTSIPIELEEGAIFSFPGLGTLNGNDDITFGIYGDTADPMYVIGVENYVVSMDDYVTSLYVYDVDGNKVNTLVERADDFIYLSDIDGFEQQYCFWYANEDLGYFKFVNLPSGEEGAILDVKMENSNITTTIDRVPVGSSYQYVSSMAQADVDAKGNALHRIVWFDADGSVDRIDAINLGNNVAMAQPYIAAQALNPYLFNTSANYEYMFLVKEYVDYQTTTRTQEFFRIYDDKSNMLLNMGPDEETGEVLSSIFLLNTERLNPTMMVVYYGDDKYTLRHVSLPLEKFNGGAGTAADPYVIATAGDLQAIQSAPNAYYVVSNDIDMNNEVWTGGKCSFSGQIDGKGYTVRNLNLKGSGIFDGLNSKAVVKNINFDGVTCTPSGTAGILVGSVDGGESVSSAPAISNIHFSNVDVFSGDRDLTFGCVAGQTSLFTSISDCSVTNLTINAHNGTVGGIVGRLNTSTTVSTCWVDGKISGYVAGGIAGASMKGDEMVKNCHVHADVEANETAGGIIGNSSRTIINNCYVDGTVSAYGTVRAYAGGIVGSMASTYESISSMVIANCLVYADVTVNEAANQHIAHRIAGFTSADEMLVDWDSNDPNVDWSDPSTYPYVPGAIEGAINNNYAIGMEVIDPEVGDSMSSTEGMGITVDDLTDEWLSSHGWYLGNSSARPWKRAGKALALYSVDFTLTSDVKELNTKDPKTYEWTVTCASRYASEIKFEVSAAAAGEITDIKVSDDGMSATCYVTNCAADGTLTATIGGETLTCSLSNGTTGINDVEAASAISYDGANVKCADAPIAVYNAAGIRVAEGYDTVSVAALPAGAYIAVSGKQVCKFSK